MSGMYADTMRPQFAVQRIGKQYRICDPQGGLLPQAFDNRQRAMVVRDALQAEADRKAKRGARRCLCCGHSFISEGIHNRLCRGCAHRSDGGSMSVPARSTAKIRRAAQA